MSLLEQRTRFPVYAVSTDNRLYMYKDALI